MFRKPKRDVNRVFIHCSASDHPHHDSVKVIEEWHKDRWPSACELYSGYHFFIAKSGVIQKSRPLEHIPIAQRGHNTKAIAICLSGLKYFTDEQMKSLYLLCKAIDTEYQGRVTFHGHCEVSAKSCPNFDYRQALNLDRFGRFDSRGRDLPPPVAYPVVKNGSRGEAVKVLQAKLGLPVDGIFGEVTQTYVQGFQYARGLVADGIVGKKTWVEVNTPAMFKG